MDAMQRQEPDARSPKGASSPWAALVAAGLAGQLAGALEGAELALSGAARYAAWTARAVLGFALAYGLAGLALGAVAACAWALAGARRGAPRARASFPGAVVWGAVLPLAGYAVWAALRLELLAPLALGIALYAGRGAASGSARRLAALERPAPWASSTALALALGLFALGGSAGLFALGAAATAAATGLASLAMLVAGAAGAARRARGGALAGLAWGAALAGWMGVARSGFPESAASPVLAQEGAAGPRPNVLLVTFDTLRADRVGAYGRAGARTPTLDALAAEGVVFEDASSQAFVTGPAHTTILTGLFPPEHGAVANGVHPRRAASSLPEWFAKAGYETAAVIAGFTLVDRSAGLAGRFDWYDDDLFAWRPLPQAATRARLVGDLARLARARGRSPERIARPAGEIVDACLTWLDRRAEARPFFLWAHFYDPHAPYAPPLELDPDPAGERADWYELSTEERRALAADPARRARMEALYEAEIAYADRELARLLAGLAERGAGLESNLLVAFTADHGESLGEHGTFFDHVALYQSELAVPLVLRLPARRHAGLRIAQPVRHVDLAATLSALAGVEAPRTSGTSLVPLLAGDSSGIEVVPAFGLLEGEVGGYALGGTQVAVRRGRAKLIHVSEHWLDTRRVDAREELYDLASDPTETRPRAPLEWDPAELEGLRNAARAWQAALEGTDVARELSEAELEDLRRLGYL